MISPRACNVTSKDGTRIAFTSVGSGPGIVFVHGSLTMGAQWLAVALGLAARFECHLMDRRGRGGSTDAGHYSLAKESEDIRAVLDAAGPGACLVGHSYGAICALEAAGRVAPLKLVLYEPPLAVDHPVVGPTFADMRAAVAGDDLDAALTIGLRDMVRVPAADLARLKTSSQWPAMVALTPLWIRECEVIRGLGLGVARYSSITVPTLLLLGTATADHHHEATRALKATLPRARVATLEGEGHFAHVTATDRVVAAIAEFIDDHEART